MKKTTRREFMKTTRAGALGATLIPAAARRQAAASRRDAYDVAVVGAGVFGAWIAHRSRHAGRVLLLDAYGAGNARSSSDGQTRSSAWALGRLSRRPVSGARGLPRRARGGTNRSCGQPSSTRSECFPGPVGV
jgi:hypothetical protein